jgi:predicted  nucleic acid-binding Zn-ribbon protein
MRKCLNCGNDNGLYASKRKKFCSDKCRVAYHRKPAPSELYLEAMTIISQFERVQKSDIVQARDSLKALKVGIDNALRTLGDEEQLERARMLEDMFQKRNSF